MHTTFAANNLFLHVRRYVHPRQQADISHIVYGFRSNRPVLSVLDLTAYLGFRPSWWPLEYGIHLPGRYCLAGKLLSSSPVDAGQCYSLMTDPVTGSGCVDYFWLRADGSCYCHEGRGSFNPASHITEAGRTRTK